MLVNEDTRFAQVEFCLSDLLLSRYFRVKGKSLGHFENDSFPFVLVGDVMVIHQREVFLLALNPVRIESHTAVHKAVFASLIPLKSFPSNLFLTIDQSVLVTMVIEV